MNPEEVQSALHVLKKGVKTTFGSQELWIDSDGRGVRQGLNSEHIPHFRTIEHGENDFKDYKQENFSNISQCSYMSRTRSLS